MRARLLAFLGIAIVPGGEGYAACWNGRRGVTLIALGLRVATE